MDKIEVSKDLMVEILSDLFMSNLSAQKFEDADAKLEKKEEEIYNKLQDVSANLTKNADGEYYEELSAEYKALIETLVGK